MGMPLVHTFYGKTSVVPESMTRRKLDPQTLAKFQSKAAGDQAVIRQTILLTKLNPDVQYSYTVSTCNNAHPFWTSDEKFIYFDSNRNSDTDPTTNPAGYYNVFRMFTDGSGLSQVRTNTANEIEPCVSIDGTTLAYVGGGALTFPNGLDAPTSNGFALFLYSIANGGTSTNLTINNPSGFTFSDVRHPSFSPGGNLMTFAGQLGAGQPYHIFTVDVGTNAITQLTGPAPGSLAGVESTDTAPAWSPDGNVIAFTTNASGFSTTGPLQATGLNAMNQTVPGDANQYDIWVVTPNTFIPDPHQVTNSSAISPVCQKQQQESRMELASHRSTADCSKSEQPQRKHFIGKPACIREHTS